MWKNASADVRAAYGGRSYLDKMINRQRQNIGGSAVTTKPVIDAQVDALVSDRPHTRYLVDGGPHGFDKYAVCTYTNGLYSAKKKRVISP